MAHLKNLEQRKRERIGKGDIILRMEASFDQREFSFGSEGKDEKDTLGAVTRY